MSWKRLKLYLRFVKPLAISSAMNNTDKFIDLCEEQGVVFKDAGQGLRFHECPFCGTNKWKAWLFKESLKGRCAKCERGYTGQSLLIAYGIDRAIVEASFGVSTDCELDLDSDLEESEDEDEVPEIAWLQNWCTIDSMPDHEASKYAISRGVDESLYEEVLINPSANSVVFLCKSLLGKVIGYQSRFLHPGLGPKTATMTGFQARLSVMFYLRAGRPIVACEGPFDAVAAYRMGFSAGCCFGSNLSYAQLVAFQMAMAQNGSKGLIAGFDNDSAGERAKRKFLNFCVDSDIPVRVAYPEFGKDLNESYCAGMKVRIVDEAPDVMLISSLR